MLNNPYKLRGAKTYYLYHYVIRKQGRMATVHLHGRRQSLFGVQRRIEIIKVGFLEGESERELLRCAAWMSPCKWRVTWLENLTQWRGTWFAPLDERLLATLTDPSQISASGG